jgi:hypothetical protein
LPSAEQLGQDEVENRGPEHLDDDERNSPLLVDEQSDQADDLSDTSDASDSEQSVVAKQVMPLLEDTPTADLYEEGLEGIASIVAYRMKNKFPELQTTVEKNMNTCLPPWVEHFSRKGRTNPSTDFIHKVKVLDSVFLQIHGNSMSREYDVIEKFVSKSKKIGCTLPLQVIRSIGKLRLDIRLRCLNLRKDKTKDAVLLVNAAAKNDKNKRATRVNLRWMKS